jgi:hypothetical protein
VAVRNGVGFGNMRFAPFLLGGTLLVAFAGASQAAVITESATYASSTLPSGGTNTVLTINKFNAPGALLSVDVELTGHSGGTLRVSRSNSGPAGSVTYTSTLGADFTLSFNSTSLPVLDIDSPVSVVVPRQSTVTSGVVGDTDSVSGNYVAPAMLSFFTGPGTVTFNLSIVRENGTVSPASNATNGFYSAARNNTAGADLVVTYTYDRPFVPAPEPMTLTLFGLGLIGLGVARRATRRG